MQASKGSSFPASHGFLRIGAPRSSTWRSLRSSGWAGWRGAKLVQPRQPGTCARKGGDGGNIIPREFFDIAEKVGQVGYELAGNKPPPKLAPKNGLGTGNGVYALLLINFGLFFINQVFHPQWMSMLALSHWAPKWWQFITAAFCHANWEHLSSNAFSLLIFGRIVEEEEGAFGVWATYLLCGVGGCAASYLTSPHTRTISLGASAAVFGLFMVGVLTKFRPSLRRLLEALILGQFVIKQVMNEVTMVTGGRAMTLGGMQVGHIAHLAGAAVGVLLVLLLARLPDVGDD